MTCPALNGVSSHLDFFRPLPMSFFPADYPPSYSTRTDVDREAFPALGPFPRTPVVAAESSRNALAATFATALFHPTSGENPRVGLLVPSCRPPRPRGLPPRKLRIVPV